MDRWMDRMSGWGCEQDVVWDGMVWGCVGWLGDSGVKSGLRSGLRRLCVVCATTETCCKCNKSIQNHAPGQPWLTPPITLVNGGKWRYIITKITLNDIENQISRHLKTRFTVTYYTKPRFAYHPTQFPTPSHNSPHTTSHYTITLIQLHPFTTLHH